MIIFTETIPPPPLVPPTDEEQAKLAAELLMQEGRWVRDFIDRLAGIVRDIKH